MENRGSNTLSEILSQPAIWNAALDAFDGQANAIRILFERGDFEQVVFTGCGSTHYLSKMAAALFQSLTQIPALAHPASEIALHPNIALALSQRTLLVAISRSGATTETLEAVRVFRNRTQSPSIAIVCDSNSPLANLADLVVAIDEAQEVSIAQTRSFGSMALAAQAFAASVAGIEYASLRALPRLCGQIVNEHHSRLQAVGADRRWDKAFFLGSGLLYGIACEAMLKMKEMSITYSEAYHSLEFRHGPMSMVNERTLVIGLISEESEKFEISVLRDMHGLGAQCIALLSAGSVPSDDRFAVINLRADVPAWARPILYLPPLQLLAYHRAMANNQDPDHPKNLDAVVSLSPF